MAAAKPTYDLMLLLDTGAPDEQRAKILADAERLITSNGGEIVPSTTGACGALAFEINHKTDAEYHLLQFEGPPAALEALNRTLHITDGVARFRIIKLAPRHAACAGRPPDAPRRAPPKRSPRRHPRTAAEPVVRARRLTPVRKSRRLRLLRNDGVPLRPCRPRSRRCRV